MFSNLKKRIRRSRAKSAEKADPILELRKALPDATEDQLETILRVQPYTMTSPERIFAICNAAEYLVQSGIEGSIVECGVWRGGSIAAAALTLTRLDDKTRELWLYDTFEGMSAPTTDDIDCWGQDAKQLLTEQDPADAKSVWCVSALQEVKQVMQSTGYPESKTNYVMGKVEDTLPSRLPNRIALLRLDTDWYESTRCEMEYLFPLLQPGGVIIIDDYGHWKGCRKAVDEYLRENSINLYLNRIDYTGRMGIKMSSPQAIAQNQKSHFHVA